MTFEKAPEAAEYANLYNKFFYRLKLKLTINMKFNSHEEQKQAK